MDYISKNPVLSAAVVVIIALFVGFLVMKFIVKPKKSKFNAMYFGEDDDEMNFGEDDDEMNFDEDDDEMNFDEDDEDSEHED